MKTKLLIATALLSFSAYAQNTVNSFYSTTVTNDGIQEDAYTILDPATELVHEAGEDVIWNFTDLIAYAQAYTRVVMPTEEDIEEYPESNVLVETRTILQNGDVNQTRYFININDEGSTLLKGVETPAFFLTYTDDAFVGDFPLSYGYTNTDAIAGSFTTDTGITGTFTGTGTSEVDAYGTLTTEIGVADNTPVTRLKTVQNLELFVGGMSMGTIVQTIYSYYSDEILATGPIFRSAVTQTLVPALGLNETSTNIDTYTGTAAAPELGLTAPIAASKFIIAKNPVADVLEFLGNQPVSGVTVSDAAGRVVLQSGQENNINVSHLSAGIYYVAVQSIKGTETLKIVKQ